jgi:hypothetical protein
MGHEDIGSDGKSSLAPTLALGIFMSYAGLTPGPLNTPEEVDRAVAEVKAIAA